MIVLYFLLGKKVSEKTSFQVQKQGKNENTQNYPVYTLEHGGKERQEDSNICYVFLFCHHFKGGYMVFLRAFISALFLYFLHVHPYLK